MRMAEEFCDRSKKMELLEEICEKVEFLRKIRNQWYMRKMGVAGIIGNSSRDGDQWYRGRY